MSTSGTLEKQTRRHGKTPSAENRVRRNQPPSQPACLPACLLHPSSIKRTSDTDWRNVVDILCRDPAKTNSLSDHESGVPELLPLHLTAPHAAALEAPLLERLLQDLFSRKGKGGKERTGRARPGRIEYWPREVGGEGSSIDVSAEGSRRTSSIAGTPEGYKGREEHRCASEGI